MNALEIKDLKKTFRVPIEPTKTLKESVIRFLQRRGGYEEFPALEGISFEVPHGQTLGIIGRNGSGKSTLFRLITRVLQPTSGGITTDGTVAAVIELKAGFHPELTGLENIFLNGAIYGLRRREVQAKLDSIIDFADIGRFLHSPSRTYSSGMLARLGFAIAISTDADILLFDEVLAVGDVEFQNKCTDKINELKQKGKTIIYVSHDMASVKSVCDRVILLQAGKLEADGAPSEVIPLYEEPGKQARKQTGKLSN